MDQFGIDTVDRIVLAGAFGAHISPKHAMVLGMIPDCDLARVTSAGNAAGTGARIALLNVAARREVEALVAQIHKVETAIEPRFQEHFVAANAIPHATAAFPHLPAAARRLLQRRRRRGQAPATRVSGPAARPEAASISMNDRHTTRQWRDLVHLSRSGATCLARPRPDEPRHCLGRAVRRSARARRRRGAAAVPSGSKSGCGRPADANASALGGRTHPDFVDGRNPEPRRSARPAAGRWAGPFAI